MKSRALGLVFLVSAASCTAQVGVHHSVEVPPDSATVCADQCKHVGLRFDGVAMVGATVACICVPADSAASSRTTRAAAAALVPLADGDGLDPVAPE